MRNESRPRALARLQNTGLTASHKPVRKLPILWLAENERGGVDAVITTAATRPMKVPHQGIHENNMYEDDYDEAFLHCHIEMRLKCKTSFACFHARLEFDSRNLQFQKLYSYILIEYFWTGTYYILLNMCWLRIDGWMNVLRTRSKLLPTYC